MVRPFDCSKQSSGPQFTPCTSLTGTNPLSLWQKEQFSAGWESMNACVSGSLNGSGFISQPLPNAIPESLRADMWSLAISELWQDRHAAVSTLTLLSSVGFLAASASGANALAPKKLLPVTVALESTVTARRSLASGSVYVSPSWQA